MILPRQSAIFTHFTAAFTEAFALCPFQLPGLGAHSGKPKLFKMTQNHFSAICTSHFQANLKEFSEFMSDFWHFEVNGPIKSQVQILKWP